MLHHGACGGWQHRRGSHFHNAQPASQLQDLFDRALCLDLADTALRLARKAGATYADIRLGRNQSESLFARERKLQHASYGLDAGFGIRVLMNGSWGFAASSSMTEAEIGRMVDAGGREWRRPTR